VLALKKSDEKMIASPAEKRGIPGRRGGWVLYHGLAPRRNLTCRRCEVPETWKNASPNNELSATGRGVRKGRDRRDAVTGVIAKNARVFSPCR